MTDTDLRVLIHVRDFTDTGTDTFYWYIDEQIVEIQAPEVVGFEGSTICHDFWMTRDVLVDKTGSLPKIIIDIDEFRISTSGVPSDRVAREKQDIIFLMEKYGAEQEVCSAYRQMLNRSLPFDPAVATQAAKIFLKIYFDLIDQAKKSGELERFFHVELPVYRVMQLSMSNGLKLDTDLLSSMRADAEYEYFHRLKIYSAKHDMPLETPSKSALEEKLISEGFELDDVSIEYLLEYVPHQTDFGGDTIALMASDNARRVLGSLSLATNKVRPVVDIFGSRTSRIQLRSPSLQNIPKKFRAIISSRDGYLLGYVDFDQFEVGIMAALSGDVKLKELYGSGDMYDLFATEHLGLSGNRKAAKQLFLSYAYGMSRKALVDAAVSLGVDRARAKAGFGLFEQYELWKKSVWADFYNKNCVSTVLGNHYNRERRGPLVGKEQRSAVSQVVQGTASLIFKKATLAANAIEDLSIVLPMHDALLFEHTSSETPELVVSAFENAMTETLGGQVKGKASVGKFSGS